MQSISSRVDLIVKKELLSYDSSTRIQTHEHCIYYKGVYEGSHVWVRDYSSQVKQMDALTRAQLFLSEAKILRDIQHECILSFYGIALESCCIVYEECSVGPLSMLISRLAPSPLFTVDQTALIPCLYDVAQGMDYLHSYSNKKYAIHGNLKAHTILVWRKQDTYHAKLSDFGFSMLRKPDAYESNPRSFFKQVPVQTDGISTETSRSLAYVPPEYRTLSHASPTKPGDVFAFGIIMMHLLTRLPEDHIIEQGEVYLSRIQTSPDLESTMEWLTSMALQCLHKKPSQRPTFNKLKTLFDHWNNKNGMPELNSKTNVIKSHPLKAEESKDAIYSQPISKMTESEYSINKSKVPSIASTQTHLTQHSQLQSIPRSLFETSILRKEIPFSSQKTNCCRINTGLTRTRMLIYMAVIVIIAGICVGVVLGVTRKPSSDTIAPTPSSATPSLLPLSKEPWYMWGGVNSYLLYAYSSQDQDEILDNLKRANIKTIRMYIKPIAANTRNIPLEHVPDLEPVIGTYNDTILERLDRLMFKASNLGMKLYIILHDRFELCVPTSFKNCSTEIDYVSTSFYNDTRIVTQFDKRLVHILTHKNPYFNNRPWGELSEAIHAFVIQEQSQVKLMNHIYQETWMCDRAQVLKPYLKNILLGTGGGENAQDSLRLSHFKCPYLDIVSIFDKEFTPSIVSQQLEQAASLGAQYGKKVVFENFNMCAVDELKAQRLEIIISRCNAYHIPWVVWGILKPSASCEFYTTDSLTWSMLTSRAKEAFSITKAMKDQGLPMSNITISY